jgi:DNA-binding Lrp family transcriptional regulator
LSNHAHVLICVTDDPEARLRDIAARVGITERACISIIAELEASGYLERDRVGRRNTYRVFLDRPLRHPMEAGHTVGDLVLAVAASGRER